MLPPLHQVAMAAPNFQAPSLTSNSKFKTSLGHSSPWATIRGEQLARRLDISAHKIFEFGIAESDTAYQLPKIGQCRSECAGTELLH
jgi:hypothetical protein